MGEATVELGQISRAPQPELTTRPMPDQTPAPQETLPELRQRLNEEAQQLSPEEVLNRVLSNNEVAIGDLGGGVSLAIALYSNYRQGVQLLSLKSPSDPSRAERFCAGRVADLEDLLVRSSTGPVDDQIEEAPPASDPPVPNSQPLLYTGQYL